MHLIKINFTGKKVGSDKFFEFTDYYFQLLYEAINCGLNVNLFCPEKDSYKDINSTIYTKQS